MSNTATITKDQGFELADGQFDLFDLGVEVITEIGADRMAAGCGSSDGCGSTCASACTSAV
ncbi:FxLD family lanthipeptide [Kitasatospora kifunensis]|uniref:FxLD family lantipeptide n=1 Tax=Kitasatospora kifunensis TaxID=58351 RepID=A0A7W7VX87_KITKI|nr:FxLD family lanthipeptide [Kitasatospora kifunensis]MBB4926206.1 FxLD family lantipeptide [Kitasatospora kifunensis]